MRPQLRDAYVEAMEAENDALRMRIRILERELGLRNSIPLMFGLTGSEGRIFSMLLQRGFASKEQLLIAATIDVTGNNVPEIKIVDVYVCKIRKKLERFGIVIATVWGRGYNLDADNRERTNSFLDAAALTEAGDGAFHERAASDGRIPSAAP